MTKPFIYSYFDSKTDLLAEICSRGIRSSLAAIDLAEAGSKGQGARDRLQIVVERFVVAVLESQKHIAIFSREEKNLDARDFQRISGYRRQFDKRLTALLDEGVSTGEFRLADTSVASLAIGGIVSWAYVWFRPHGRLAIAEVAAHLSALVLAMACGGSATPLQPSSSPSLQSAALRMTGKKRAAQPGQRLGRRTALT